MAYKFVFEPIASLDDTYLIRIGQAVFGKKDTLRWGPLP
jgi:hypothetical protein